MTIMGVLFAMSAVTTYLAARRASASQVPVTPELLDNVLVRARRALEEGQHQQASLMARAVADAAPTPELKVVALEVSAWGAVLAGDVAEARAALREVPSGRHLDVLLRAAIYEADDDPEQAASELEQARRSGDQRPEVIGALVRVFVRQGRFQPACALAAEHLDQLDPSHLRQLAEQALAGQAALAAAHLWDALYQHEGRAEDALAGAIAFVRAERPDAARDLVARALASGDLDRGRLEAEGELEQIAVGLRPAG
jgi:uncharacterized protein HemY